MRTNVHERAPTFVDARATIRECARKFVNTSEWPRTRSTVIERVRTFVKGPSGPWILAIRLGNLRGIFNTRFFKVHRGMLIPY